MFNYLISGIAGLALLMGGTGIYFDRQDNLEKERLGLATYKSIQVGGSPTADYILSTDGTDSTWIANAGGGGGGTGTVGTSTSETAGGVPYWTSTSGTPALLGEVASTSIAAGTGLSFTGTLGALLGGVSGTLNAEVQTSDLHDAVTLSGALNYITLVGQDIVRGFIDLTADVTGVLPNANVAEDLTITAGTIENTPIGASTPSTAKFTNSTSTGSIYTGTKNLSNYADFYNGTFAENFNALVMSDGVTASTTITSTVGSTLTLRFSDGDTATTTPLVIELTAGSDASPQANYIYIPQSTKSLTKSTTAWPDWTTEFIKIGYFLCPSLSTIQTNDGCYINQNWNDGNGNGSTVDKGHLVDLTYRSRLDGAKYFSGIDGNGDSSTYLVITAGNVELKSTAGVILQMHPHTFPAFDTSAGDEVLVKNWSGDAYHNITNLNDITADSTGGSTSGKWMNLVIWGVGNKGADNYEPVMINLPACSYNNQASAEQDVSGCDDFTMPREFNLDSSTGFLISRITVRDQATWSYGSAVDLRGTSPSVATGGASGVATNFADNTFSIFDETTGFANTFQLSGLSADRLITTPDAAGTMTLNGRTDTNYLLDNADDISSGSLTATEFIASDATATSTFAGGLAIETSGLVYDFTSNNVGIGTASPVVPLDVNGSISSLALFVDDLTLNGNAISSSGASSLTLTATAGQAVAVEGVSFDGGVVTGASSISSTGFTGALTGNADTATALAANGGNCVAGSYPLGVDASGAVESCTDATTEINSAISTHAGVAAAHQALVTLAGTPNYLTLSGQAITLAKLDITDDTNLIAGTNITLSTNTLNVDDAFLINDGDDTTTGQLTAANFVASSASATSTFAGGLTVDTSKFFVDPDAGRVGVGTAAPEALIFEMAGAAVGGSPNASGDDVIIRGYNVGLSFLSPNTNQQTVLFGDADDNDIGGFFYTHSTDAMTLRTNGIQSVLMDSTNSMTLANGELIVQGTGDSSFVGNVGIGTTSPSDVLSVTGDVSFSEGTNYRNFYWDATNGYLGIGTTSPNQQLTIQGTGSKIAVTRNNGDHANRPAGTEFQRSRGTVQVPTIVQDGDVIGSFAMRGYDGALYTQAAGFQVKVDGTPGTNDMPGLLEFLTTADGASSWSTRLTIEEDGDFLMNSTTAAVGSDPLCWDSSGASYWGDCSSLLKWKTNLNKLDVGLKEVLQLEPYSFDWKYKDNAVTDGEEYDELIFDQGFIADYVEEVNPLLVDYNQEGELTDINERAIMGAIINAIQELFTKHNDDTEMLLSRIEALEKKIESLESPNQCTI